MTTLDLDDLDVVLGEVMELMVKSQIQLKVPAT
jgi:hypothetical protein